MLLVGVWSRLLRRSGYEGWICHWIVGLRPGGSCPEGIGFGFRIRVSQTSKPAMVRHFDMLSAGSLTTGRQWEMSVAHGGTVCAAVTGSDLTHGQGVLRDLRACLGGAFAETGAPCEMPCRQPKKDAVLCVLCGRGGDVTLQDRLSRRLSGEMFRC